MFPIRMVQWEMGALNLSRDGLMVFDNVLEIPESFLIQRINDGSPCSGNFCHNGLYCLSIGIGTQFDTGRIDPILNF